MQQSKELAKILPLESADIVYVHTVDLEGDEHYDIDFRNNQPLFEDDICAWSLAALLSVLSQSITKYIESERCQKTFHFNLFRSYYCCVSYDEVPSVNDDDSLCCIGRDNWVDACYEMILKLNEFKIL